MPNFYFAERRAGWFAVVHKRGPMEHVEFAWLTSGHAAEAIAFQLNLRLAAA